MLQRFDIDTKLHIPVSELAYYLFLCPILMAKAFGLYDGQIAFKIVLLAALLGFIVKMILTTYSLKEAGLSIGLLALGFISYRVSGDKGMLLYIMMIVGAKNLSTRRIMKIAGITFCGSFVLMSVVTATRMINGPVKIHEKLGHLMARWCLGQAHPNVLHVSYLLFCIFVIYMTQSSKKKNLILFLLMLGNIYIFLYSVSFTGLIAVIVFLMLCLYWTIMHGKSQKIMSWEKILLYGGFAFCVLFSMLAPILLRGRAFELLNKAVNTRLELSRYFLTTYPVSLWGHRISEIVTSSITMDCSYVYAYEAYGIVIFVLIIMGYGFLMKKLIREQRGVELCIVLACLIAGVTEPFLFNASFKNMSLLFFAEILYRQPAEETGTEAADDQGIFKETKEKKIGGYLLIFCIGAVIALVAGMLLVKPYDRIIVSRSDRDFDELDFMELNITAEELREGDILLGNNFHDDWMQLTGFEPRLEYVRCIVTVSLLGGILLMVIYESLNRIRTKHINTGKSSE